MPLVDFGPYTGEDLFKLEFEEKQWLIESMAYCGDSILFLGAEKSGKSIMMKQMIAALTSGSDFLGLPIIAPQQVCYVQLEGELSDTQQRMVRIRKHTPIDEKNLLVMFSKPLSLHKFEVGQQLINDISNIMMPQVLIIDPLYMCAVGGSLSDDATICAVIGNLRLIKMFFGCTLILVHHTHKVKLNQFGEVIGEGDNASFGSVFLKAWPDHVLLLRHDKKDDLRHLSCSTQRSGQIEKSMILKLEQPDPLYFKQIDSQEARFIYNNNSQRIIDLLNKHPEGLSVKRIIEILHMSRNSFYQSKPYFKDAVQVVGKAPHSLYKIAEKNEA